VYDSSAHRLRIFIVVDHASRTQKELMMRTTTMEVAPEAAPEVSAAQQTRFGPGGGLYRIVTRAAETANRLFAFEAIEPPGGGPPLHIHATEDEYFLVLEGEITFFIDGQVVKASAGESAFVPRGVPHCFKNCSTQLARVFVLFTPGQIEGFFDYGLPVNDARPSDEYLIERIMALGPRFNLEVLGPSQL
jgi:quercetin dioxygenase-like cupin family protein